MSLGGILLTQNLVEDTSFGDLWPVLAIAVGVSIIFGPRRHRGKKHGFGMRFEGHGRRWKKHRRSHSAEENGDFFSGGSRQVEGEYTGSTGRVRLSSGGIDLSSATLPEDGATLRLDIKLGEYRIRVPNDWKLDIQADVTMGEIGDDREAVEEGRSGPTLTIGGHVLMGGVHITS